MPTQAGRGTAVSNAMAQNLLLILSGSLAESQNNEKRLCQVQVWCGNDEKGTERVKQPKTDTHFILSPG